jgi:rhamnose transport system permease protein
MPASGRAGRGGLPAPRVAAARPSVCGRRPTRPGAGGTAVKRFALGLFVRWETVLVVLIVLVAIWCRSLSPLFFTKLNLLDLATPYIFVGLMALGLTFVVIAGEIDISVASILAVSVVVLGQVFEAGANIWFAALVGLLVAFGLGIVNGFLVAVVGLPSLAVTLGTLAAYRGIAFLIHSGEGVASFPTNFTNAGAGYFWGQQVPIALPVFLGSAVVLGFLLHATRFGRYIYALGSNREAARFSGIPVTRTRMMVFGLSGLMAGIAGIVYVGFFGSSRADAADGSLLDVVTAVVLGGVNIFGGAGSMVGVVLAVILVAEIRNGMLLDNIGGDTQNIVIGVLLLAAILAGNAIRALQTSGLRTRIARARGKGVVRTKGQAEGIS